MVIVKSTTACVLLALLCGAWLSTARLHPSAGAGPNGTSATKASVVAYAINSTRIQVAIDGILMKKPSAKQVARKCGNAKPSPRSSVEIIKRSLRTRLSGDAVDVGFVAFTADYHSPRHHPPKNNK